MINMLYIYHVLIHIHKHTYTKAILINRNKHIIPPGSGDHVGWSPRFNNNDNTHNVVLMITIELIVIVIVTNKNHDDNSYNSLYV